MDWSNESYVRIYTRDTTTWKLLGWRGQSVLVLFARRLDRAGMLEAPNLEPWEAVTLHTGLPEEVARPGVQACLDRGVLARTGDTLFMPNYIPAQETPKSDRARQKSSRDRRAAAAKAGIDMTELGSIYVLRAGDGTIKVGFAVDVAARVRNLRTARPDGLELLAEKPGSTIAQERDLLAALAPWRVGGEWFRAGPELFEALERAGIILSRPATPPSRPVIETSQAVTRSHATSHDVTLTSASASTQTSSSADAEEASAAAAVIPIDSGERERALAVRGARWCVETCGLEPWSPLGKLAPFFAELGRKPEAEKRVAAGVLLAEGRRSAAVRRILKPDHILTYWPDYSQGRSPGQREAGPVSESPGAARVRKVREQCAAEIAVRRAGSPEGMRFDLDRMEAEHLSRINGVISAVEREGSFRGGPSSLGAMLAKR